jgi:hypothetical protein
MKTAELKARVKKIIQDELKRLGFEAYEFEVSSLHLKALEYYVNALNPAECLRHCFNWKDDSKSKGLRNPMIFITILGEFLDNAKTTKL